jgi:hypothetical protein
LMSLLMEELFGELEATTTDGCFCREWFFRRPLRVLRI